MTRTKTQLLKDLEDEEVGELDLIQQREDMWLSVDLQVTSLRKQCVMLSQQIEETKNDYLTLGATTRSDHS
jgi:Holliday junction resolvase-like predicted endonuclease